MFGSFVIGEKAARSFLALAVLLWPHRYTALHRGQISLNSDRCCNNDNSISTRPRLSRFSPGGIFSKCIFLRFEYDSSVPGWPSREFRIRRFVNLLFSATPRKVATLFAMHACMHAYAGIERAYPVAFRLDFVSSPRETSLYATPYIFFPTISSQYTLFLLLLSARKFPLFLLFSKFTRAAFGKDPHGYVKL